MITLRAPDSIIRTQADAWRRRSPNLSEHNALLLSATDNELNIRIHHLPLELILAIAKFLCGAQNPGKPLEWLIISALLQSYNSKQLDSQSLAFSQEEEANISKAFFQSTIVFHGSSTHPSSSSSTRYSAALKQLSDETAAKHSLLVDALKHEQWLVNKIQNECTNLISASAARVAKALLEGDNRAQLSMVMVFGNYAEKNIALYYLITTLFSTNYECDALFKMPDKETEYQESYNKIMRYVSFLTKHKTQEWVNTHIQRVDGTDSIEERLKIWHYGYFQSGKSILRKRSPEQRLLFLGMSADNNRIENTTNTKTSVEKHTRKSSCMIL